jgi:hypothetical protein
MGSERRAAGAEGLPGVGKGDKVKADLMKRRYD